MLKHLRITVDGKAYDVVVEDLTEETGGSLYPAPGTMAQAARVAEMAATPAPAAAATAPAGAASANDKLAPLGGVVKEILVKVGDAVKAGDKVMVLEAMKMKTTITAHKDGKVAAIAVNVGDAVEAGQVLVSIA